MLSNLIGMLAAFALGFVAWRTAATNGFYASELYGMTARSHRRFSLLCLVFAGAFGLAAAWPLVPGLAIWTLFIIAGLLYGSSFLRGYADHDS